MLKAVCVEAGEWTDAGAAPSHARSTNWRSCCSHALRAGMLALRREGTIIKHEDFVEGITAVQMKKKAELQYYA